MKPKNQVEEDDKLLKLGIHKYVETWILKPQPYIGQLLNNDHCHKTSVSTPH
jgi:hypothetical protein